MKRIAIAILVLSLLGIAVSGYALYLHSAPGDSFCNLTETFNCDIVNTGSYSELAGIPVAVFGIAGYLGLGAGAIYSLRRKSFAFAVVVAASAGLIFALYLTGIEAFVLQTYCIVCLASQAFILAIFILSIFLRVSCGCKHE